MATKSEIMEELTKLGIEFDPKAKKSELEQLLPSEEFSGVVDVANLNMRVAPSLDAELIAVLKKGTPVRGEVQGDWLAVDGGFVLAKFLKKNSH